jgi:Holliday junction resolvase
MANKNYIKGRRLEYEVMKTLREDFSEVMRTAGSHGMFDVIAVGAHTLFVQVKSSRRESEKAMEGIIAANLDSTNRYEVWWKEKGSWKILTMS